MAETPENLRYTTDHEWAEIRGDVVRIGITDYAQTALGDVVMVEVPQVGATLTAGAVFGAVESPKSVSDLFAPTSGTVVAVNEDLDDHPEKVNEDPYGAGWIIEIKVADLAAVADLIDAAAYAAYIDSLDH